MQDNPLPLALLQQYWNFTSFRPLQEEIIDSVMKGKDTLALLPTGGGKSLCFQIPALAKPGLCLVISPLIALIKDQAEALKQKGIKTLMIHSGMKREELTKTLDRATHGDYKFLYVSPERLETSLFKEYLPYLKLNLIAVDEAHCVSQWGFDFRPSYLRIAAIREVLPHIPMLALTATATPEVQTDILLQLHMQQPAVFKQSFARPNLSFRVIACDIKIKAAEDLLAREKGSVIIYCRSRKRTVETAALLKLKGIQAEAYHAGLTQEERHTRQTAWMQDKLQVIVSTNAFGMGIDKANVRLVIHLDIPDCLENYYQEAGRAGRDGKPSLAVLLYHINDLADLEQEENLRYPSLDIIEQVYHHLVNFLQIPVHTGLGQPFVFRFNEFVRNHKLNAYETLFVIKALEQDGWFDYNEKSFAPSSVVFTTNKSSLYEFQSAHPELEPILTALLRSYEGIFDYPAYIAEKSLAWQLRKEENQIKLLLQQAAAFGMIRYHPQNDAPHIVFRKNRVSVADLNFNIAAYEKRKKNFVLRLQAMILYVKSPICRSIYICNYFDDSKNSPCGICDNCMARHSRMHPFSELSNQILLLLKQQKLTAEEIRERLPSIAVSDIKEAIDFMIGEEILIADGMYLHIAINKTLKSHF